MSRDPTVEFGLFASCPAVTTAMFSALTVRSGEPSTCFADFHTSSVGEMMFVWS
jgi:hypothetical protein